MGGSNSTVKEKLKNSSQKQQKEFEGIVDRQLTRKINKISEERNGDMKCNLTIRIYSDEKCPDLYKNYLNSIKMDDWIIQYIDNGFSKENTERLIKIYQKKSENKRNFDEVLVIIINSYETFIKTMEDENKNFLEQFNLSLFQEQQPFIFFLNKNIDDFEYTVFNEISSDKIKNKKIEEIEKECIDYISENKETYNVEIHYEIEFSRLEQINSFLVSKRRNNNFFNIIFKNNYEFQYSGKYIDGDNSNLIKQSLEDINKITIRNLDYNFNLADDITFLNEISKSGTAKINFKCYKPTFKIEFQDYLTKYELLDKRNYKMQYYYISPFKDFQKFCGYYHEYGDALIKDKFVKYPSKINIGVCGRAGSGKSTFLNVILGEKRCLEGQGQSVSTFMTNYSHPKYPINFVDFPGFGDKENAENLIKKINEKKDQLEEIKEKFHIILYCVRFGERTFLDKEEDVIYELMKLNIKIFFVFTKGEKEDSQKFKRYKINFMNDLKEILLKKNIRINEANIDIVSIYSMRDKFICGIVKPFGIDILFKKIYDYLKVKKIDERIMEQIKSMKDEKEIEQIIKSTNLYEIYQSRKELMKIIRYKCSIQISFFYCRYYLNYPKYYLKNEVDYALCFLTDMNDLMLEISSSYCYALDKDELVKLSNEISYKIKKWFSEKNIEQLYQDAPINSSSSGLHYIIFFPIVSSISYLIFAIYSKKLTNEICDEFEKNAKINISHYLYQFSKGLNEGIEGCNKISEEFGEYYKNQ